MRHKEDKLSGLPEPLHEGGYFQIIPAATMGRLRLYYRIKHRWWFDERVEWTMLDSFDNNSVYRAAEVLLDKISTREGKWNQMDNLIGKYPPKQLGKRENDE